MQPLASAPGVRTGVPVRPGRARPTKGRVIATIGWFTVGCAVLAAQQGPGVLGTWDATERSAGGLGTRLQFHSDSTLTRTYGAMVDGTYRLTDSTLAVTFLEPSGAPAGPTVAFTLRYSADTLVRTGPGPGDQLRLVRVGDAAPSPNSPLVGTWTYPHPAGAEAFETFTSDGAMLLRVPMRIDRGSYRVSADSLTLDFPDSGPSVARFTVHGDTLRLVTVDGATEYRRVP